MYKYSEYFITARASVGFSMFLHVHFNFGHLSMASYWDCLFSLIILIWGFDRISWFKLIPQREYPMNPFFCYLIVNMKYNSRLNVCSGIDSIVSNHSDRHCSYIYWFVSPFSLSNKVWKQAWPSRATLEISSRLPYRFPFE